MTEQRGLLEPPPVGTLALPAGTYAGSCVFVTGGGTGLGKAIAAEFARLGADLVVASRKPEHLDAGRQSVDALGARVLGVTCDIRDADQVAAAFDEATAAFGLPDVLINNAAANFPVPAEDMSPNAWRTVVDITLNGTFFCSREFARRHIEAGTAGSIVNVGASYAWTGGPGFAHSAAAKAGVKNMVETLAVEWGPYGIQVNGLVPGLFPHEDMTADIKRQPRSDQREGRLPARATGRPTAGAGLGRDLPRLTVRPVHLRAHPRRRRGQLAASDADECSRGHGTRPDGAGAVRSGVGRPVDSPMLRRS